MISKKMLAAINDQINFELYSGYIYLAMAADFRDKGMNGFANWMEIQNKEETFHGMKMYDYLAQRGGRIELKAIGQPPKTWKTPLAAFEHALEHEQVVTARINKLVDLALAEKDHASANFLQWYVNEQVEEEANVSEIIGQLKMAKDAPNLVFMLDRELGQRTFTPPATAADAT
jgi:ferritin